MEGKSSEQAKGGQPPAGRSDERPLSQVKIRRPDGALPQFHEIVDLHPWVAFLFRRRTLIVLLGMVALLPIARPEFPFFVAGVTVMVLGEALRIWAAGTIHKTERLTTGGPYAYVRHPLYVGSLLLAAAFCLMTSRWESLLVAVPIFAAGYGAAISTEEKMLRHLFPQEYEEYARRVPRLIPRLTPAHPAHGAFSWRQAWGNKEYINLIWMVGLLMLFAWKMIAASG